MAGTSRRKFFFMFGAGVAATALAGSLPFGGDLDDFVLGVRRTAPVTFPVEFRPYVQVVVQMAKSYGVDVVGKETIPFGVGSMISFRTNAPIGSLHVGSCVKVDGVGLLAPSDGFKDPIVGHIVSATLVLDEKKR